MDETQGNVPLAMASSHHVIQHAPKLKDCRIPVDYRQQFRVVAIHSSHLPKPWAVFDRISTKPF